ncbi:hypothetical protein DICVIV_05891 [Dictyocaulus viviparus]|uniref:SCP domain-containing protein n=1 Tax=Dictyocaulus viviparus TaxID=29172 RepID=A0A0D8XW41_DICVI|nr:hypothetical protein DICVIV_05891 [Dictyocaulus viviparus]
MDHTLREDALRFHNAVRYYTAASHRRHEIRIHFDAYPTAANMSLMSMRGWWETNGHLGNLTPTADDRSMIPYLQLINDRTTKVGCSYSICNSTDSASFGMFVCKYGEPYVRAGVPIYTEGPPCSLCKGRCVARALCNNTDII